MPDLKDPDTSIWTYWLDYVSEIPPVSYALRILLFEYQRLLASMMQTLKSAPSFLLTLKYWCIWVLKLIFAEISLSPGSCHIKIEHQFCVTIEKSWRLFTCRYLRGADFLGLCTSYNWPACFLIRRLLELSPFCLGRQVSQPSHILSLNIHS